MKKLVISVVLACLASGQAFAAGGSSLLKDGKAAVEDLGSAAKGIKGGEAAKGAKANGQSAAKGDGTASKKVTADGDKTVGSNATGVDSHVSCPADSAMNQVSRGEQEAIFEATAMNIGGSACAVNFTSKSSVEVVAAADAAAVKEAKRIGVTDALKASLAQKLSIAKAAVRGIAAKMGIDVAAAKKKYEQLCQKGCDVANKVMCEVAGQGAVATN